MRAKLGGAQRHRPAGVGGPVELADALGLQARQHGTKQAVDSWIVEAAGDGRIDGHFGIRDARAVGMISAPLLAHVAQRILCAALLEFIQHHHLGVIEHVDLLELARRTVFAGHHVQGQIHQVGDLGVALTDAGRLDQHQVETGVTVKIDDVLQYGGCGQMLAARRQ